MDFVVHTQTIASLLKGVKKKRMKGEREWKKKRREEKEGMKKKIRGKKEKT